MRKLILVIVIPWVATVIGLLFFTNWLGVQIQQNTILIIFGLGLYWIFARFLHYVNFLHLGHWPIEWGGFLFLLGYGFLYGDLQIFYSGSQWWNLSIPQLGVFSLSIVIGILLFIFGLVQVWRNQYFSMRKK